MFKVQVKESSYHGVDLIVDSVGDLMRLIYAAAAAGNEEIVIPLEGISIEEETEEE